MFGAAWALKPLRTDSVSRGLSISLLTYETISLAISIRPFFFMKRPFFKRWLVNYRIEFGADTALDIPQMRSDCACRCLFGS